jgi:hypothetical protein
VSRFISFPHPLLETGLITIRPVSRVQHYHPLVLTPFAPAPEAIIGQKIGLRAAPTAQATPNAGQIADIGKLGYNERIKFIFLYQIISGGDSFRCHLDPIFALIMLIFSR